MKIAIPSNDKENIAQRTGQSKGFMVYELIDKTIVSSEYRENKMDEHDEDAEHSHQQIIDLLRDVDILFVAAIGKFLKKDINNSTINYQIAKEEKLAQIIETFLNEKINNSQMQQINDAISRVMHPAINLNLTTLGIVKDVEIKENTAIVTFALPFPNIPIVELLINSIKYPISNLGFDFDSKIVIMTEDERQKFLHLESSAWKGM